jgi:hypothetical protein
VDEWCNYGVIDQGIFDLIKDTKMQIRAQISIGRVYISNTQLNV